jgi:hypothetical protein
MRCSCCLCHKQLLPGIALLLRLQLVLLLLLLLQCHGRAAAQLLRRSGHPTCALLVLLGVEALLILVKLVFNGIVNHVVLIAGLRTQEGQQHNLLTSTEHKDPLAQG